MSLYRQTGRRSIGTMLAVLGGGLVVGALVGFVLAKSAEDEPSLAEQISSLREDARSVSSALELVAIEYRPAVRDGAVVAPTEYQATLDAANRAQQAFSEISPGVEALNPAGAVEVRASIEKLAGLVEDKAEPAAVRQSSRVATARLKATLGKQG